VTLLRQSYALLLEEAHDSRTVVGCLYEEFDGRLAVIEACLPQACPDEPQVLASVDDLNEMTMLDLRIRDEGSATANAVTRLLAAAGR
jgi:hypothetical protein